MVNIKKYLYFMGNNIFKREEEENKIQKRAILDKKKRS
jgi:hypothetical protein